MNDSDYRDARAEYAAAKDAFEQWRGKQGPAHEVIDAERRLDQAAARLAELVIQRERWR